MLADINAGHAQAVGSAGENHIPKVAQIAAVDDRQHVIDTADQDRSPDQEDSQLTQTPVFEGVGVGQQRHSTEGEQGNDPGIKARGDERINPGKGGQNTADDEPADLLRLGEEALHQRMHTVHRTKVIAVIHAARVIGVIVQDIVGAVRNEEAQSRG